MTMSVKKELNINSVFSGRRLVLLSSVLLIMGTIVIYLYDKVVIRYTSIAIVVIFALLNKKKIINALKQIRKK